MIHQKFGKSFIKQEMWDGWDGFSSSNYGSKSYNKKTGKKNHNFYFASIEKELSSLSKELESDFKNIEKEFSKMNDEFDDMHFYEKLTERKKRYSNESVKKEKESQEKKNSELIQQKMTSISAAIQSIIVE